MTVVRSGKRLQRNSRKSRRSSRSSFYIIEEYPCQRTNIAVKIVERSLKRHFASQKPTNSRPARTVTAQALEKNYLPFLFLLEQDHLHPPALLQAIAQPAADFPEEAKFNGRVPFTQN